MKPKLPPDTEVPIITAVSQLKAAHSLRFKELENRSNMLGNLKLFYDVQALQDENDALYTEVEEEQQAQDCDFKSEGSGMLTLSDRATAVCNEKAAGKISKSSSSTAATRGDGSQII